MTSVVQNASISNLNSIMAQGRRMSFPVDPSSLIYAHFEHVFGRAAPQGTQGVSISQLNLLDTLLRQLVRTRQETPPPVLTAPDSNISSGTPEYFDAVIENYRGAVLQSREASIAMPYLPSPNIEGGAVFSMVV